MDLQLPRPSSSSSIASMQALCYSASAVDGMGDGSVLSIECHRSMPAPFLTKTYQLVDDPATDHIVSWGEDESTFVVWRPPEFARDLLPSYFKHNNFSSFVRQLNTYGFRKIVPDRWEFANDFFRKGEKHLLCEIHRRKTAHNRSSPTNSSEDLELQHQAIMPAWSNLPAPAMGGSTCGAALMAMAAAQQRGMTMHYAAAGYAAAPPPEHLGRTVEVSARQLQGGPLPLSDDNERLRRENTLLLSELVRMKRSYHDLLLCVQQQNVQQGQAASCMVGAPSHGMPVISELSSQSSSFNHISSSQRSVIYHSSPSMGAMQSTVESPTSRLRTCAEDTAKPLLSTTATLIVPTPATTKLLGSTPTGRNNNVLPQSSFVYGDLRNLRSPAVTPSSTAQAESTLVAKFTSNDKMMEGRTKCIADDGKTCHFKLFGVPLQSSKKRAVADIECEEPQHGDSLIISETSLTTSLSLSKNAKANSKLPLELKQKKPSSSINSMRAPWLSFKAPRDEEVYN